MLALKIRAELVGDGWDHGRLSVLARLERMGLPGLASPATRARIFPATGVVKPEPKKKPRRGLRRFVYPAPNCLWQIDATAWSLADGSQCVIFQVIDDHSRKAVGSLVACSETSAAAVAVVSAAIARHGAPQKFLSDNGLALNPSRRGNTNELVDYLTGLGVETIPGKPFKPTTQGKNERFHQTLNCWLNACPAAKTMSELQDLVDTFDLAYKTQRVHQGLSGRQTPHQAGDATQTVASPTLLPTAIEVIAAQNTLSARGPGPQGQDRPRHLEQRRDRVLRPTRHPHHRPPLASQGHTTNRKRTSARENVHEVLRNRNAHDVPRHKCARSPETLHPLVRARLPRTGTNP